MRASREPNFLSWLETKWRGLIRVLREGQDRILGYGSIYQSQVSVFRKWRNTASTLPPVEKSQHDELAALADKMLYLNKRLHNELEQLTFLQVCDLSAVPAQAGEINPSCLPLKEMGDRFRIAITGSKRKKLTP